MPHDVHVQVRVCTVHFIVLKDAHKTHAASCVMIAPAQTSMFRTDRWLNKFNDPLVKALTEHEGAVALLTSAQEQRVNSANEVLASMRQIAGLASFTACR